MNKNYSRGYISKFDDSYELVDQELELLCSAEILSEVERYKIPEDVKQYFRSNDLLITPDILNKLRLVNYDMDEYLKIVNVVDYVELRYLVMVRCPFIGVKLDYLDVVDREIIFYIHDSLVVYDEILKLDITSMLVLLLRFGLYNQDSKLMVLDKINSDYELKSNILVKDKMVNYRLDILKILDVLDLVDVGARRYTLKDVGDLLGISRERVRQVEYLSVRKVFILCSKRLLGNYQMLFGFDFSVDVIQEVFNVNSLVCSRFSKLFVFDNKLSGSSFFDFFACRFDCVKGKFYSLNGYLEFNGIFVRNRRRDVIEYAFSLLGPGSYDGDELVLILERFFADYDLDYEVGAKKALCALIERMRWIKSGNKYRLHGDFDSDLFRVFITDIMLGQGDFFSTKIIYEKYGAILRDTFDIMNHNELHYLLKRDVKIDGIIYERNPHISRGVDFKSFLSDSIISYKGNFLDDFLEDFESRTGVIRSTIMANYVDVLDLFYFNSERILIDNVISLADLNDLRSLYLDEIYCVSTCLDDVKKYSKAAFKEIGYRFMGSFLIREDFTGLDDVVRSFSFDGVLRFEDLPACLKSSSEFKVFLYKRRASLDLVEFESGKYLYVSNSLKVSCERLLSELRLLVDVEYAVTLDEFVQLACSLDYGVFGKFSYKFFGSISYALNSVRFSQGILFDYRCSNYFVIEKYLRKKRAIDMCGVFDYLKNVRKLDSAEKIVSKLCARGHYHFESELDMLFYDKVCFVDYLRFGDIGGSK